MFYVPAGLHIVSPASKEPQYVVLTLKWSEVKEYSQGSLKPELCSRGINTRRIQISVSATASALSVKSFHP